MTKILDWLVVILDNVKEAMNSQEKSNQFQGSGAFTGNLRELPVISGGYDLAETGDSDFQR